MTISDLSRAAWRKSSHSGANGDCVEVAASPNIVAVRDSKRPDGAILVFSPAAVGNLCRRSEAGAQHLATFSAKAAQLVPNPASYSHPGGEKRSPQEGVAST